ncbi:MAG: sensor histidine kinase [Peptococcaceae bacterium]|jgi:two-component system sensor histidine kinase DctS|nr:sensor histidine kinase [Peptococcaceae bacterium]
MKNTHLTLGGKMAVLSFATVLLVILTSSFFILQKISAVIEREMGLRAMAIARTLAQSDELKQALLGPGPDRQIQDLAERSRLATNAAYVVVLNMRGIRYADPLPSRIGTPFTDADVAPALADHEYLSRTEGVLGPAVRAFVPVMTDGGTRQIGVVVVGVLTPTRLALFGNIQTQLLLSLVAGLAIGLMGSLLLARNIKRATFSLEPEQIARLLKERTAIFMAMSEAIVAIDKNGLITFANEQACRIIGLPDTPAGHPITSFIPNSRLPRVMQTGRPEYNREMVLNTTPVLVNRVPIVAGGQIIGAVSTFREKTELSRLAEEMTGVKKFVEALRVQTHEYMNRLHTIAGMVQLGHTDQAIDFIFSFTEEQQELTAFLARRVSDPGLAGLIMGKYSRAKELRIEMEIDRQSHLANIPSQLGTGALVVLLGNLLENAVEAAADNPDGHVYLGLFDGPQGLTIVLTDNGPGVAPGNRQRVYDLGFSTKDAENRGVGLFLVKNHVENAGGTIVLDSPPEGGTRFTVTIPAGPSPSGE